MAITYFNIPPNGIISQIQAIVLYKISDFVSLRYQPASISSTGGQVFIECDSEKALARLVFDGTYWDLQIDHYVHDTESEIYKFAAANRYEPFVVHFKHNGIWYLTGDADLPYTIRNEFASGTAPEESRNHLLKISGKFYQRPEQAANDAVLLEYATTYLIKSQGTKGGVMNMAFIDESDIISTLESDDTLLDMQIVGALSREVDIFQFEDGTQFNIIRDGERLSTASISSEIQNIPSGFMEYLLEKRYSHKVGIIEMNDGERYVVGSKKHPVRWDIKEDQGTDTQMVVIDFRFEARQSIKLYEGLDEYLSNDIPLFDQFPDFFENALAFSTVKYVDSYAGPCLRVSNQDSLVETDISFTFYNGRYWIDRAACITALNGSSDPLLVTRAYLQGFNEDGNLYAAPPTITNALKLLIGDTPETTYLLNNASNTHFKYDGIARKNIRENNSTSDYDYSLNAYRSLDLFVIDEKYDDQNDHTLIGTFGSARNRVVRFSTFTRIQSTRYLGGMVNHTDSYPVGEKMSDDISFSYSLKKGVVAYYIESDGSNTLAGIKYRFIYKDWKHKLVNVGSTVVRPQVNPHFMGPQDSDSPVDYKCYAWIRAHEVDDNFTGIDPSLLIEINRAINKIHGITENEYLGV